MPNLSGGGGAGIETPVSVANGGTGAADAAGARTNLGLGAAATKAVGTGADQVAAGNHNHSGVYEPANGNIQSHISDTNNPHSTSDANLITTDVTTNNSSAAKHGFAPKLSGVATQYLDGDGNWSVPAGAGASTALDNLASVAINTSLISDTDNTDDLGSAAKVWANGYMNKLRSKLGTTLDVNDNFAGEVSAITTNTALATTMGYGAACVVNGYIYLIGGNNGSTLNTVRYAKLLGNGTIGTWGTTTVIPAARQQHAVTVCNGYIYVIGGNGPASTVYVAKPNADGTITAWVTTTSIPAARNNVKAVSANGMIYVIAGDNGASGQTTVYGARPLANGEIVAWSTLNALNTGRYQHMAAIGGGYVYALAGNDSLKSVEYAAINADGTLGAWATTTALPVTTSITGGQAIVANGYLYVIGGAVDGSVDNNIYYGRIGADGTIASWSTSTVTLPTNIQYHGIAIANGYIYTLGAWDGGLYRNYVYSFQLSRQRVSGDLDLVGNTVQSLGIGQGRMGGSIYAADGNFAGRVEVADGVTAGPGGVHTLGGLSGSDLALSKTITGATDTGDKTINKACGTVRIAAAGTTVTVTNNLVTANSIVIATLLTDDTTASILNVVPSAGSFVIKLAAAATAEVAIGFLVIN